MPGISFGIDLDIEHLLGNSSALARPKQTRILNCVLEKKKDTGLCPKIGFID